jgi:hypothetical protein
MPKPIPVLQLTQGQVAWTLSLGQPPSKQTIDQLRYLRQIGVPFSEAELGGGRGYHVQYGYVHLVECGLALYAIRRGMVPREAAEYLISQRQTLRPLYRRAFRELPENALSGEWVKSRGKQGAILASSYDLRMHNRYSQTPGKIEVEMLPNPQTGALPGDMVERFPDSESRLLVPLSRLVLEWTAWALEAPELKRGPKSNER